MYKPASTTIIVLRLYRVNAPGVWGTHSPMRNGIFPMGLYLVGDNAYSNSNKFLTPFTKPKTKTPSHDSINFHLSQLRIRVEMAFGLLVNKWRVFKQPLKVRMKNVKKVVHVACILHNWCMDQRLSDEGGDDIENDEDLVKAIQSLGDDERDMAFDPSVAAGDLSEYRRLYRSTQIEPEPTVVSELVRGAIVYKLGSNNQLRPAYNVRRAEAEKLNAGQ
ncbi:unnamed protein product [Phytophthora fragariaefolia]|uniref:Unnamed protein product n=1 Tax=Phytophthora fragariaefolia TaxID=1490495 RepID=A0A9W7CXL5_9STRA|nr:unnamed protein product [Phytophthora fragariaefolia]